MSSLNESPFSSLEEDYMNLDYPAKTIMLYGLPSSGRSCAYNWILGNPMIGQANEVKVNYLNLVQNDSRTAKMGEGSFDDINISQLNQDTSLIDPPHLDEIYQHGISMKTSYFLQQFFRRARLVKFIVVVSEAQYLDESGRSLASSLLGFLKLFRSTDLNLFKHQIFDSVSLLVTSSKQSLIYNTFLRNLSLKLKHRNFKVEEKSLMIELLDYLLNQNRIGEFQQALPIRDCPKSTIIQDFDNLNWQFLDLNALRRYGSNFNHIMKMEYQKLTIQQKDQISQSFIAGIGRKIDWINGFQQIVLQIINNFHMNCTLIHPESDQNQIVDQDGKPILKRFMRFGSIFEKIESFIEGMNINRVSVQQRLYYRPELFEYLSILSKIYSLSAESQGKIQSSSNFKNIIFEYLQYFNAISDLLVALCSSERKERSLKLMKQIMKREIDSIERLSGFLEYFDQPEQINFYKNELKIRLNLQEENQKMIFFIRKIEIKLSFQLFANEISLAKYETLIRSLKRKLEERGQISIENRQLIQEKLQDIDFLKAESSFRTSKQLQYLQQMILSLKETFTNQTSPQKKERSKIMSIFIVDSLINLSIRVYKKAFSLALIFCEMYGLSYQIGRIFEEIIHNPEYQHYQQSIERLCAEYFVFSESFFSERSFHSKFKDILLPLALEWGQTFRFNYKYYELKQLTDFIRDLKAFFEVQKQREGILFDSQAIKGDLLVKFNEFKVLQPQQ